MATTFIREYKNMKLAQRDMAKLGKLGFEAVSTSQLAQRTGIGRFMLIGFASLVFKPKPHIMVTYRGEGTPPATGALARNAEVNAALMRWTKNTLVPWAKAHPDWAAVCGFGSLALFILIVVVANVAH